MSTFDYPTIDMQATGAKMRELRKQNKLTIKTVCTALGVSPQALGKWESGKSLPTLDNLYALSYLYKTKMNDILVESKNQPLV